MGHSVNREIEVLLSRLNSFARYLTRDQSDADDLVQASVERALRKLHQFTPGTNLKAWLAVAKILGDGSRKRRTSAAPCLPPCNHIMCSRTAMVVRRVDRHVRRRTPDRRAPRPSDPPRPHPGNERPILPARTKPIEAKTLIQD